MRLTLHDNIHGSAGEAHPEARAPVGGAARSAWSKAMRGLLARCDAAGGGRVAADFKVGGRRLRMRARRHGSAVSVVWSVDGDERVVGASVVLAGERVADDAAAMAALRERVPALPFGPADYTRVWAEPRPCLASLYLDARWYDNARVELAATSLAYAALLPTDGPAPVRSGAPPAAEPRPAGEVAAPPAAPAPARGLAPAAPGRAPWFDGTPRTLTFDFTRPRLQVVMDMVTKKATAAMAARPGVHFRVYPPAEFFGLPGVLRGERIYDRLAETSWSVRWYDGRHDRLSFGEFLGFVHQVIEIERAFHAAVRRTTPTPSRRQNDAVWGPRPEGAGVPVRVSRTLNTRDLVTDETIRRLMGAVALESKSDAPSGAAVA